MLNYSYIFIAILISLAILTILQKRYKLNRILFILLFIYHAFFCVVYYYFILSNYGDALTYYKHALYSYPYFLEYPVGTNFIKTIVYPLVQFFDMNFFVVSFLFSLFGFFGLLIFYLVVKENIGKNKLFSIILFIPGLNFWTASLGKDTLSFFAIALITFGFSKLDKRKGLIIIGLLLLMLIRPHMAMIIVFAASLAVFISSKSISFKSKLFLLMGSISFVVLSADMILEYLKLDSLSIESIEENIGKRASYNTEGGGGVDIANYNTAMKMFTYLFRPLFFDSFGLLSLIVSLENLFYLILFSMMLNRNFFKFILKTSLFIKFNFIYGILALMLLSATTANLGIAIRQKNMFILNMFIVILFFIYNRKKRKDLK